MRYNPLVVNVRTFSNLCSKSIDMPSQTAALKLASWNIAAVNNNPFEYWITYPDPTYSTLLDDVQKFITNPDQHDIPIKMVFTQDMWEDLRKAMHQIGWDGIDETNKMWETNFKNRRIVTQFLQDALLGKKRLASMPDRITNTINTESGQVKMRPTVINGATNDMTTTHLWWDAWKTFMFVETVTLKNGEVQTPVDMLRSIPRAKYPALTKEEERISKPLQTLSLAIFDAIQVHIMNTLAPNIWQPLKKELSNQFNKNKVNRILEILNTSYDDSDIIFLQEVAVAFIDQLKNSDLGQHFVASFPKTLDAKRDQNSIILLNKTLFNSGWSDITDEIMPLFEGKTVPIGKGDLFVCTVQSAHGEKYVLASFHGDTNGLATIPVVAAVNSVVRTNYPDHIFLFGLDANTYEKKDDGTQHVNDFVNDFVNKGLTSCWGYKPQPSNYTTFNARTYLQPQLNKACSQKEIKVKGDINPKDFILMEANTFSVLEATKDNTGQRKYKENMVFPTIDFPSDHAIISCALSELTE